MNKMVSFFKKDIFKLNLKGLRGKMMLIVLVPILVQFIQSVLVNKEITKLSANNVQTLENTVPSLTTSKEIQIEIVKLDQAINLAYLSKSQDDKDLQISESEASIEKINSAFERYNKFEIANKALALRTSASKKWNESLVETNGSLELLKNKQFDSAEQKIKNSVLPILGELKDILQNIELNNLESIESEIKNAKAGAANAKYIAIVALAIGIVLSLLFGLIMSSKVSNRIEGLTRLLGQAVESSQQESEALVESSESLVKMSSETASAVVQASATMEKVKDVVQQNAENTKHSAQASNENVENVNEGRSMLNEVRDAFSELQKVKVQLSNEVQKSNEQFAGVFQMIAGISEKTRVIHDIVLQTKLLSFNASVEAARAGENGKGFSVVAGEIGALARHSGGAAQEISEMIEQSQQKTNDILNSTKESMTAVSEGIQINIEKSLNLIEKSLHAFDQIFQKTSEVNQQMTEINVSTQSQLDAIEEMKKAIEIIGTVAEKNKSEGDKLAINSSVLLKSAENVQDAASSLDHVISGRV